jgi:glycosyltransferase involved in cell wall biosynthesis
VINPSIWATTTEFVLLEVLGMSKPVITFDVGIHREIIRNRINGICVKAGDFTAMGNEINNLADDPALEARIAPAAKGLYHQLTDDSSFTGILTGIFK